jgi:hypothetical protein
VSDARKCKFCFECKTIPGTPLCRCAAGMWRGEKYSVTYISCLPAEHPINLLAGVCTEFDGEDDNA